MYVNGKIVNTLMKKLKKESFIDASNILLSETFIAF